MKKSVLVIAGALILAGTAFHFSPYKTYSIPSDGMAPLIKQGDHILADVHYYDRHQPQDNDIVIVRLPTGQEFVRKIERATTRDARVVAINPDAVPRGAEDALIPFTLLHGRVAAIYYSADISRIGVIPEPEAVVQPEFQ